MIPKNCNECELEMYSKIGYCFRSREVFEDGYKDIPGPECPYTLLAAKERECERLREAAREFMLLFASGNSIPVDRVVLKADHRIVNMFRAALAEGSGD